MRPVSAFVGEMLRDHGIDLTAPLRPQSADESRARLEALQQEAAVRERRIRTSALLTRGVPAKDIVHIVAGDLLETHALATVRRWLLDDQAPRLLVLAGGKDAGKTTACAIAVEADPSEADQQWLTARAPRGRYVEAELLLKAWWHKDFVAPDDPTGKRRVTEDPVTGLSPATLVHCSLLAIDDVGQEPGQFIDGVAEALDVLVRLRCDRRRRTVISTNLETAAAFIDRYSVSGRGQRISERLTEHGVWVRCPFEGLRAPGRRAQVLARRESKQEKRT